MTRIVNMCRVACWKSVRQEVNSSSYNLHGDMTLRRLFGIHVNREKNMQN